ncbi:Putative WEB family protein [Apostasia shenzhenica]|uniref:WEB family protein n=1 Tax=Apostasia shenzhenica TaxID=1088818 RepID=A0A2I0ACJ4_9ASPA|nr:Putative WEB family protein [Apostasia shenzhenica]
MLSSKSKSSLSDGSGNKTPRVSKIGRLGSAKVDPDSPSPQQNPRLSVERSPRSADAKPSTDRRSPKLSPLPDKQPRPLKGSELQAQLTIVQEDLRKAKEKLASEEEEKSRVLVELEEAKKAAEVANEKLEEARLAQRKAEENSELDKFRADELEQSAIEAAQKKEEEVQKELENIRNQHAVDVVSLLSATQELQRVKNELTMTTDAKNTALSHADDAMKIAEVNAEKVELLSGELSHLKSLLDSKLESKSKETAELIKKLGSEAEDLKLELSKAKEAEKMLVDMESFVERLKIEMTTAKTAESKALDLVNEWKKKVELLNAQLEESSHSEKLLQDSLASLMKQLEEGKSRCDDAELEATSLKGKVEALELELARHKADLEESDQRLNSAKQDVAYLEETIEVLKSEIGRVEGEKAQVLNNEKLATSNVENLAQDNNKLRIELEKIREESEKAKKAMEGLASALHEASREARETQERLLIKQAEVENASEEVEELKMSLKNAQEKYELLLDEAKYEIICLKKSAEKSETEANDLRAEWDAKEHILIDTIKKSEEEIASVKLEMDKTVEELERKEEEAKSAAEETNKLLDKINQVEMEFIAANKSIEEARAESSRFKEMLLDKENEHQSVIQENNDLRIREAASLDKIKNLSNLLMEATSVKSGENGDIEVKEDDEKGGEISKSRKEGIEENVSERMDSKPDEFEFENGNYEEEEPEKTEVNVSDGGKAMDKQLSSEREHDTESVDDESNLKVDGSNLDQVNGENAGNWNSASPTKQLQQQQKKKKALLQKFGSLLKKKSHNPKQQIY